MELPDRAEQAARLDALQRMAGAMAHDVNNLLTAILGHAFLLEDDPGAPPNVRESGAEIRKAAERAEDLMRQLLAFSRRQVLHLESLDLNTVVEDALPALRALAGVDIALELGVSPDPGVVRADRTHLRLVVLNLATNACESMPAGGRLTITTATLDLDGAGAAALGLPAGGYVRLTVSDTGGGMSPEVRARIFEPWFTTKASRRFTGLGLSTAYGIVQQCGGSIAAGSDPGRGTTMAVHLPRC